MSSVFHDKGNFEKQKEKKKNHFMHSKLKQHVSNARWQHSKYFFLPGDESFKLQGNTLQSISSQNDMAEFCSTIKL